MLKRLTLALLVLPPTIGSVARADDQTDRILPVMLQACVDGCSSVHDVMRCTSACTCMIDETRRQILRRSPNVLLKAPIDPQEKSGIATAVAEVCSAQFKALQ